MQNESLMNKFYKDPNMAKSYRFNSKLNEDFYAGEKSSTALG